MLGTFSSKQHQLKQNMRANKRRHIFSLWPSIKRYCLFPILLIFLIILLIQISRSTFFPITKVEVIDPAKHINQTALQAVVNKDLDKGFFNIQLNTIKKDVLTLPWVSDAQVSRKWPDGIQISIHERKPLALWGTESLVDTHGAIFTPEKTTIPHALPAFSGTPDALDDMIKNYTLFNQILKAKGLSVKAINVTERMSWLVTINNGIEIELGRKEMLERLHRFVLVYDTIFASTNEKAQYVDMRYPNAMAVHWQQS